MGGDDSRPAIAAGGTGAMVACCTVHLLVFFGIAGGLGAFAVSGLAAAAGVLAAAVAWLVITLVRRRRVAAAGNRQHRLPAGDVPSGQPERSSRG